MPENQINAYQSDFMREILNLLSINDDEALYDEHVFWRSVATIIAVHTDGSLIDVARTVMNSLTEWDDDYLTEEGDALSNEVYGDLLALVNQATLNGTRPWTSDNGQNPSQDPDLDGDDDQSDESTTQGINQRSTPDVETVLNMVFRGELVVNPEWQRNFVWPLKKQRRFIESVLMRLPIPSVMLFDNGEGTNFVIDGRQRLETLVRFCATPEQRENLTFLGPRFKTFSAQEPGWQQGQDLHEGANKNYAQLPETFRRIILRAPLTLFTFRQMQPRQLYQIFQRYNTGADKLKAAEIRNAVYQASDLHKLLWRVAGESPDRLPYEDNEEEYFAETLRNVMQNKTARYGAYDFLGRVMAFTYLDNNKTVAAATNDFMDQFETSDHESLRKALFRAFEKVLDWYTYPLTTPSQQGQFHNFLGTIQLATTHKALDLIDSGEITEPQVVNAISSGWLSFADETLELKQNSGNFWGRQKIWLDKIKSIDSVEV